jgi:RHS repeat-associated protein
MTEDPPGTWTVDTVVDARTFQWDGVHNKIQRADVRTGGPEREFDYAYDDLSRLTTATLTQSGTDTVEWDYTLNDVGSRSNIQKTVESDPPVVTNHTFTSDANTHAYSATPDWTSREYDDNGSLLLLDENLGTEVSFKYNHLDQMTERTDASGTTDYVYDALGTPLTGTAYGNPYLFTGRRYDPESQFYYYRNRYYDPRVGQFTTRDPIGIWGDPGNLGNGYAYVGNCPWNLVDPYGYDAESVWQTIKSTYKDYALYSYKEGALGLYDWTVDSLEMLDQGMRLNPLSPLFDPELYLQTARNQWNTAYAIWRDPYGAYVSTGDAMVEYLMDFDCRDAGYLLPDLAGAMLALGELRAMRRAGNVADDLGRGARKSFDNARREAFEKAGMTDPSQVSFTKYDKTTGTVVEFKGPGGAKVGYDGPHSSPGPHHDTQHISWQTGGKRSSGGAQRGNIEYTGPQHPSRPGRK